MSPLLTILIVVCVTAVTALWNIHIKFAPTKEAAMGLWKKVVFWGFNILALGWQCYNFVTLVSSKEPITRQSIAFMIIAGVGAGYVLVVLNINLINSTVGGILDNEGKHVEATKALAVFTKTVADQSKNLHEGQMHVLEKLDERVKHLEQKLLPPSSQPPPSDNP